MIVKTLLDIDLYKFATSYTYIKLFPYAMGTFSFDDRNETEYIEEFLEALKNEFSKLSWLRLTEEELRYMTRNYRSLSRVYWEWLSSFRFDPDKIDIHLDTTDRLHIEVSDSLYEVTLYEVSLLVTVSEIKDRFFGNVPDMSEILCKLSEKVGLSNQHQLHFSEFDTWRGFSTDVQETVIKRLNDTAKYCTGASNCYFAMEYSMEIMGTHPHEWFMFYGVQSGYKHANYMALESWANVYNGDLGIALSNTYTSGIFLNSLSRKQAELFDGVRCDPGNESDFIDKLVACYRELGIDATTKTIVFSNALDFTKALEIQEYCKDKIRCSFGIGTDLTDDTGFAPSNIVMKLTRCKMNVNQEQRERIKLLDDKGKHTGSPEEVQAYLYELRLVK